MEIYSGQQTVTGFEPLITHDSSLKERVVDHDGFRGGIVVAKMHGGVIVINGVVHTRHHTLVIAEEEDGQGGHTIDPEQKTLLLILVDQVPFWNAIHLDEGDKFTAVSSRIGNIGKRQALKNGRGYT